MNRFNRFIITVLFGLFTSQAFALDFTQATKDTKFIVSDTNNVIRVYLDNFSAMQISAIPLKNSAGTQILFTHMFVASASNGVGDSSDELIKLGHITLQENTTLYKIWDVAIGANAINAIKNDFNSRGNRVFTITTAYNNDPVATDQGSFIRGDNE